MTLLATGSTVEMVLRLARNMLLVRLLAPENFGLMALVMSTTLAFQAFTEVGIKHSVIQNERGDESDYLNVAWWFQAVRGLGLFLVGLFTAPWLSAFYNDPALERLFQVSFLAIIFNGLMSPRAHVLEKKLRFSKVVLLMQGGSFLSILLTMVLAFFMRNVWALVIGFVSEAFLRFVLSYILCPFRPRFSIDNKCFKELLKYARGMFGLPILTVISLQADIFVLGKIMPKDTLGLYHMARLLAQYPLVLFGKTIYPVLLPAFSEKQKENRKLNDMVLVVTRMLSIFGFPAVAVITMCASSIMTVIYGPDYAVMAFPFAIISVGIFIRIQASPIASVFLALGRPHIHRLFVGLRAFFLLVAIYPSVIWFGFPGAAAAVLLSLLIVLVIQIIYTRRSLNLQLNRYFYFWFQGMLLSIAVFAPFALIKHFDINSTWSYLSVGLITCMGAWVIGMIYLRPFANVHTMR